MSRVSEISRQYHRALSTSQEQYESLYQERAEATKSFYEQFFHSRVCDFSTAFHNPRMRARLQEQIQRVTGTNTLQFIAVDGTCQREVFSDMVTFFGGAYGARGELKLTGGEHQLAYKRWSLDHDVSMVAWIPVPFARLEEVTEPSERFLVTEEEKVNLSSIHVQVMQLAEIFLAYNSVIASRLDSPHVLLMDLSPSSVLAGTAHNQDNIGLVGYPYDRRSLSAADISVALSHPFSKELGIPTSKRMDYLRILISSLHDSPNRSIRPAEVAATHGLDRHQLVRAATFLAERGVLEASQHDKGSYHPALNVRESWSYTRDFFQNICTRLFLDKDPAALQYESPDQYGAVRSRWMAPDDLNFLIAVGMRLLIEACWERKILFYGVTKDSSSRYLTRNFLGVALETNFYPELRNMDVDPLPWTDRIFCETLPLIDEDISAPWSTIEFDSAFMTLHRERIEGSNSTKVAGIMGRIVNQERLFARSLGQFFLKREKQTPLMGHVVFLERLLSPTWDRIGTDEGPAQIPINTSELGKLSAFAWRDRDHANPGQWVMMYLLSVLTRNHFAEAVGYPDPLHKADWGAKTIGRGVADTIRSSTQLLASRPLSRTFRAIRDAARR